MMCILLLWYLGVPAASLVLNASSDVKYKRGRGTQAREDTASTSAVRVFDGFMLNHEFEVFRAHVLELKEIVDVFLVVEGELNHRLQRKERFFAREFIDRMGDHAKFHYKFAPATMIEGMKINWRQQWLYENMQRDTILDAFLEAGGSDSDIIIVADVDEIMNKACFNHMTQNFNLAETIVHWVIPTTSNFKYTFNCHTENSWWKPAITSGRVAKLIGTQNVRESDVGGGCCDRERFKCSPATESGVSRVYVEPEEKCGWQLSTFGGLELALRKVRDNADGLWVDHDNADSDLLSAVKACRYEVDSSRYYPTQDASTMSFPDIPEYISKHQDEFRCFLNAEESC
jgi:hypothetical protein